MTSLHQKFTVEYSYPVYFTNHLFALDNALFGEYLLNHSSPHTQHKVLFVIDDAIMSHHPQLSNQIATYFKQLPQIRLIEEFVVVKGGEYAKNNQSELDKIIEAINQYGIDRHSYVVGIGGGAVLDLVGFGSTIAHRGVRHIRIPTTVLSQNDSGIGVKNSINYKGKKNFLGTFSPAVAVFNDYEFLSTLPFRDWISGVSEAIKVALIKDLSFYRWIQQHAEELAQGNAEAIKYLIYRCAELHLEHIRNGDPFEFGSSRPLDFGHWSAHKLEQVSNFEVLHGEAVSIGIALDVVYSHEIGNLTRQEADEVLQLLHRLGLPIFHPLFLTSENNNLLSDGLSEFREHLGGRLTIVLLEKLGLGKEYHELDLILLTKSIIYLSEYQHKYLANENR